MNREPTSIPAALERHRRRLTILISAYACEPGRGSEAGAGWNWAIAAARRHVVWVITRANNGPRIEAARLNDPSLPAINFVYVDLPKWSLIWKRGGLGIRVYYVIWQLLVAREARRLHRQINFDLVHHITLANVFLPALAHQHGVPFVLGPVAGGQRVPLKLYKLLGPGSSLLEVCLLSARFLSRLLPLTRSAWRRANVILANNEETRDVLPRRYRSKVVLRPSVCMERAGRAPANVTLPRGRSRAICAGRLSRFKGVAIAIRALRLAPEWELIIIGDGHDKHRLRRIADREGVADRARFLPSLEQDALWHELASSDALVVPSLKEGASFVAAEAQALGVPVVALDQGGPAVLARFPGARFELVEVGAERVCVEGFAAALARVRRHPRPPTADFSLSSVEHDVDAVYQTATEPSYGAVGAHLPTA